MLKFWAPVGRCAFAPLFAGVLILAGCSFNANAESGPSAAYIISDQDGYGLLECLTGKDDCGQIVADSWCAAHGHGAARTFGRAEDASAPTETKASGSSIQPDAAIVACMD